MSDVAAYHVRTCVCVVSSAGRYVDWKQRTHKYMIWCQIAHNNGIFIILTREFSKEQYVLPDDDMRYAVETCRSSLSVLV